MSDRRRRRKTSQLQYTDCIQCRPSFRFDWHGSFRTLKEQNEAALRDPTLMNTTWDELLPKLRADPRYPDDFSAIYGTGPQRDTVLDALVSFQRSLRTPNSRFDRYLNGERDAISADEEHGYRLFKANGCSPATRAPTSAATCSRNSAFSRTRLPATS